MEPSDIDLYPNVWQSTTIKVEAPGGWIDLTVNRLDGYTGEHQQEFLTAALQKAFHRALLHIRESEVGL